MTLKKANPGGQIDPKDVVGRDEIITDIWDALEQQSIRMNAERRIGKTTIIQKIRAEPRKGWMPIFQDLEQYHTASEFAMAIYREVESFLSIYKKTAHRARELLKSIGGTEIGGIIKLPTLSKETPWKDILRCAVQDLVNEQTKNGDRPLFLWDEVPYMLDSIKKGQSESVAIEVLDTLRGLRQTHGSRGLRMVFTGSIGLHHVIKSLKDKNYGNAPVNDMLLIEVPPLNLEHACKLATSLIKGENINTKTLKKTANAVAEASDGFPFYLHHIVKALKRSRLDGHPDTIEGIVSEQLQDANDPWELMHYRTRIPIYYEKESEKSVLGILDGIAVRADAISLDDLLAELKSTGTLDDREQLIDLLSSIEQDHYLSRNTNNQYRFRFTLLQRWWKLSRGL